MGRKKLYDTPKLKREADRAKRLRWHQRCVPLPHTSPESYLTKLQKPRLPVGRHEATVRRQSRREGNSTAQTIYSSGGGYTVRI